MKTFLAVYIGSKTGAAAKKWESLDAEKRKELEKAGMNGWMDWVKNNSKSIVTVGNPLGKTKHISADGISDVTNQHAGYTIVQAENQQEAAKLFLNHPHFTLFPGDSVEVMECLPTPGL